ncbi:hypothetical protein B296_00031724, partial [Ensete ventricosum]
LPRLGASSTHVWVKSERTDRASRAQNITPFTISDKGSYYPINIGVQKDLRTMKLVCIRSTCETTKQACAYTK